MDTAKIIDYAMVIRTVDQYAKVDSDYTQRLFIAKQTIFNMVDKVYANYGKYKFIPTLDELEWDPEKYVPERKMEVIIDLVKVLEVMRYQDMVIQAQALDLGRTSYQAQIIKQKHLKTQERFDNQQEYIKTLIK